MTAVSSSSVATVSNSAGWPAIACAIVSVAVDRRRRSEVGGDHEEVLAAGGLREAGVAGLADRQLGGALEAEVGLRVGVGQVVGDLAALEQHVERDDGATGLEDAEVDDREVRQVGAAQRDLVTGLDPARDQGVGDHVGEGVDLRVGQPGVTEDDRGAVGIGRGAVLEKRGQVVASSCRQHTAAWRRSLRTAYGAARSSTAPSGARRPRPRTTIVGSTSQPSAVVGEGQGQRRREAAPGADLGPAVRPVELGGLHRRADPRLRDVDPGLPDPRLAVDVLDAGQAGLPLGDGSAGRRGSRRRPRSSPGTGTFTRTRR